MSTIAPDKFDFQPMLRGPTITLRPLVAEDFDALHAAAADPLIWEQHPDPMRHDRAIFAERFFADAVRSGSAFIVTDNATGTVIGSSRFYEWEPDKRAVAIGFTFLARSHWGGPANAEMKRLMLDHAFLWADTVWLHIGAANLRSRKAAEKIGARLDHEAPRVLAGVEHMYCYYRLDASRRMTA